MQPKFLEVQIARISAVFNRSKLQMDAVCDLETNVTKRWEPLFEYNRDRYFFYNRFRRNPEEFLSNRLLDIGRYTNALYFYKENLPELRKQFQFNDNILEAAQNAVNLAKANFSAVSNMTEVLLIGIHCRRTDLLSKVHRPAARYSRIDGNFYNQAMAMYRFKYNKVDQRVLFIATSDDPKWLKENLQGVNNDLYLSADLIPGDISLPRRSFVNEYI